MELRQGDVLDLNAMGLFGEHPSINKLFIQVNDGPSWHASPRGCLICLTKQEDGRYVIGSIIKEQGPAVAMGVGNAIITLQKVKNEQSQMYHW